MTEDNIEDALERAALEQQAMENYSETSSYQGVLAQRYLRFQHYVTPRNGDQWPEDLSERPGMVHITHNVIAPAVMTEARIESIQPKISLRAESEDEAQRQRAESAEKILMLWLELSGWDVWLFDACQAKSTFGKTILKPFWNKKDKRGDVRVVENPANLRLGWGASDFTELDWALYEYGLSPAAVQRRFKLKFTPRNREGKLFVTRLGGDHADPIGQMVNMPAPPSGGSKTLSRPVPYQPSTYEENQLRVWDYWYKDGETVKNAVFVEGVLADGPHEHPEYPDIPYIVVEHDRETGSPEGVGDVEPLVDIQIELNRAFSHYAQLIADEVDPAWQIDADSAPPGMVPKGGQMIAAGDGKQIRPFEKPVQVFPIDTLIKALMDAFHMRSGLSEILFAMPPGAQTAGRALQIQIEASANRIDPRRRRLYAGLKELLVFWAFMAEKVNPRIQIGVDEQGAPQMVGLKEVLEGFRRWRIIAPEITPRDNLEMITAVVNKLTNKLISLEDAMDELGVDSPLEMITKIEKERMNPRLFPGDTQAFVAVLAMLQQYQQTAQQLGLGGGDPAAQAAGTQQDQAQEAQPSGVQGDNGSDVAQPGAAPGLPEPAGAGLQNQTLIRAQPNGSAQTLQQIKTTA